MSGTPIGLDQTEEILTDQISDEALETAASAAISGVYTQFAFCTFSGCPA